MGTSASKFSELGDNKYLQLFSSRNHISQNDPFWNQLLSFTFIPPHNCADCKLLEENTKPLLDTLLSNNPYTGNFATLVQVFLTRSSELRESVLCENKVFMCQTHNSLFILRSILKYFIETAGEESMIKQFSRDSMISKNPDSLKEAENLIEELVNALIAIIVEVALGNVTYTIIVETVNTLLVLLSVQMFSTCPARTSVVYQIIMKGRCNIRAFAVVKELLSHYVSQEKCPHCLSSFEGNGLVSGIASGIWNILTLSYVRGSVAKDNSCKSLLANQSLLLLLALVNHCTNEVLIKNPYREALFTFCDKECQKISNASPSFRLHFGHLYQTLCRTLKDDQTTLITYLLLHKNVDFKHYIVSCPNIEIFIVPLLKILYHAQEKNSHHIYMALIVLLILSEDECFDKDIHHIKLKNISWYTERNLPEITLGSLVVLILTRTIQYNMTRMHDKYLHTNCLAALANMSAHFQQLHPYVCQKFVGLLEIMTKKQVRMSAKLKSEEDSGNSSDDSKFVVDLAQDMSILEEVIRMLLEILNSCLSAQLKNNVNLIYAMLYNQRVFVNFLSHPGFDDIMQNISKVIKFFSEHVKVVDRNPSVLEVAEMINAAASEWSRDQMKKFPELKFKYVEEGQPEDFFIPYLWSLVFHASDIYWNPKNILIFNPHKAM